jgi:hypothetical protein
LVRATSWTEGFPRPGAEPPSDVLGQVGDAVQVAAALLGQALWRGIGPTTTLSASADADRRRSGLADRLTCASRPADDVAEWASRSRARWRRGNRPCWPASLAAGPWSAIR